MRTKKAIYNIITNLILQVIIVIYSFIVPKIIISNYGSNVNGLVSSITQFLGYISLIEAGFGGVVRYLLYKPISQKNTREINNILSASKKFFNRVCKIFIVYIFLMCCFYPFLVNNSFDNIYTISLIIIISISIFAEYYFGLNYKMLLLADQKNYIISLISIGVYILNIIFIVVLSKFNLSIHILKLASTLLFVLRPLVQNFYIKKHYNIKLSDGDKKYKIQQKWDALAQHVAAVIHSGTDTAILTIFCDISEVSVYGVYHMVVSGINKLVSIFYDSVSAAFGDMIAKKEYDILNDRFSVTESLYFTLITMIYSCTILLIVPFISIYTKNITDANYIRYTFGILITISEFIWAIRLPYSSLTNSAGHYKETRNGAIIECLTNIVISIILVFKFGIIGVAIGTMVAMLIRTCEFLYHSNKYILKRNIWKSVRKLILLVLETTLLIIFIGKFNLFPYNGYFGWLLNAIIIFLIIFIFILLVNGVIYRNDFIIFVHMTKNILNHKK